MDLKKRKLDENGSPDIFLSSEDVKKLIDPFSRDQLLDILQQAALQHPDVLSSIRKLADKDPVHRKLFVRGLGWDTTTESVKSLFSQYGEIEEAIVITDKSTGKSKGYGFVTFKHMDGAHRALKEPSKKIEGRMTVCQLASAGPVQQQNSQSLAARKIYVGNVPIDLHADKLLALFSQYGEIEEGPLGFDKQTGRSRGFALFIYKSLESAKRCLEEPLKEIDGHQMHCKLAEVQKQRGGSSQGEGLELTLTQTPSSNLTYSAMNPSTLTGGIPLNQSLNLSVNQGLSQSLNSALAAQGFSSSISPTVAQQLASLSPSFHSCLPSSLAASLTQGGSQGLAQALGQVSTSAGLASYGIHGLGALGSQVAALVGPQSGYTGVAGASLYGVPSNSQTSVLQGTGVHHSLAALQNAQLAQSSGHRSQSLTSYYN